MARHSTHFDELIDIAELKALSGEASFAKGLQLASQGWVQQTSDSPNHHDTLVQFYLELGRGQDACDWVANHRIPPPLLLTLAGQILSSNPVLGMDTTSGRQAAMWMRAITTAIRRIANGIIMLIPHIIQSVAASAHGLQRDDDGARIISANACQQPP